MYQRTHRVGKHPALLTNTRVDRPYLFIQPSIDYVADEAYCETSM